MKIHVKRININGSYSDIYIFKFDFARIIWNYSLQSRAMKYIFHNNKITTLK